MNKIMKINKRGYSQAVTWIYSLVSLFGIGVLYIVFNQVFLGHLVPTIKNQVIVSDISNATQVTILANIDSYMTYFHFLPYVLFGAVVFYMLINSFRKEQEETF